jgi:hypothetical protein
MYVLYYASMLCCWHLIWILVRTDHPYLGVGCHRGGGAGCSMGAGRSERRRGAQLGHGPERAESGSAGCNASAGLSEWQAVARGVAACVRRRGGARLWRRCEQGGCATWGRRRRKMDLWLEFNLPISTVDDLKKRIGLQKMVVPLEIAS